MKASIDQAIAHVNSLQATVESDQAAADASRAQAEKAAKDFQRTMELFRTRVVSAQDQDAARATNDSDQAQLQANLKKVASDRAQVAEARATVNTYLALLKSAGANIEEAAANLQAAMLNESYTEIGAPEDGRVTEKAVEPGDYVQTGQTLFALVPANVWVTANYKEDQIGFMRPGQPAEIEIDALHGQTFPGHVDSIQSGTAHVSACCRRRTRRATTSKWSSACRSRSCLTACRKWGAIGAGRIGCAHGQGPGFSLFTLRFTGDGRRDCRLDAGRVLVSKPAQASQSATRN